MSFLKVLLGIEQIVNSRLSLLFSACVRTGVYSLICLFRPEEMRTKGSHDHVKRLSKMLKTKMK